MEKSLLELLKAEDLALCGFQSKRDLEKDTLKIIEGIYFRMERNSC